VQHFSRLRFERSRRGLGTSDILTVGQTGVEELYEQNAGRVFAYCFARVASRNVAEWAVNATFDRARAAIANGGIPEPELDWLLRTADKFCAPKLCLDARPLESMVVLQDWWGRSFDQIATELEARWARLEEERRRLTPWRRVLGAFNLGPAISWVKGVLGGLGAVKATATAVALLGAIAVVGTPLGTKLHSAVWPGESHATPISTPSKSPTSAPAKATQPEGAAKTQRSSPAPGRAAATANGAAKVGATDGAAKPSSPAPSGTGPTGGGTQAPPGAGEGVAPAGQPRAASSTGVSASASVTTTSKPTPSQPTSSPTLAVPTLTTTTPSTSLPATTLPSTTLPSTDISTLPTTTLPSVDTSAVPTVSTPTVGVPSTSTPSTPTVTTPSVSMPTVTTPSVPSPPRTSTTVPTVTVPLG
jgi:hypothetical protein